MEYHCSAALIYPKSKLNAMRIVWTWFPQLRESQGDRSILIPGNISFHSDGITIFFCLITCKCTLCKANKPRWVSNFRKKYFNKSNFSHFAERIIALPFHHVSLFHFRARLSVLKILLTGLMTLSEMSMLKI